MLIPHGWSMTWTTAVARSSGVISQYSTESTSICSGRSAPVCKLPAFSRNWAPFGPTMPMTAASLTTPPARLVPRTPVGLTVVNCDIPFPSGRSVRRDDGLEFVGRRAMHNQRVGPVVEFLADPVHALLSRPSRRRLQPLVGNQCRDVFDLLGCGFVVDPAGDRRHHRVSPKPLQDSGVPV